MHGSLRVLTLNCWNVSAPFDERMQLIRAGIEALQPDLVGLQEIIVRRDGFDQGAILLEGLGYERVYGAAFRWTESASLLPPDHEGDAFGNLVASRWPIRESAVHALPGSESGERRCALTTLVETPFGNVAFTSTHLNWKFHHGHVREEQVQAIVQVVEQQARAATFPPIVVGDFNAEPDSREVRFLCGLASIDGRSTYFQDAWRVAGDGGAGYTWDNRNPFAAYVFEPNRRIDYVFVGLPDWHGRGWIESARLVLHEPVNGVFPSDHFGLLVEIRV